MATSKLTTQQIKHQNRLQALRRQIQVQQRLIEVEKRKARAAARARIAARYILSSLTPAQRMQRKRNLANAIARARARNQAERLRASLRRHMK